jgi:dsDNA-specific endonuclease/ATPase MutS2
MEFNKQELRTIMNALRLQVETYRKIENQENINEEDLANVIMDRGYTESLLDAISDDYNNISPSLADKCRINVANVG